MAQFIYSIGALSSMMLFSFLILVSRNATQQIIYVNELSTQVTGIADEVLDLIDSPDIVYDSNTGTLGAWKTTTGELSSYDSFGGCKVLSACVDVDDFHGLKATRTHQGLDYSVAITVSYVSTTNPDSVVTTPTLSKLVTVEVKSGAVIINGDSLSASISRVITYDQPGI